MEETGNLLGVGSRVKHPAFGDGVVIRLHKVAYEICFILYGIKMVGKDYGKLEIIESIPVQTAVSFSEAEKALMKILQYWSDISQVIELAGKRAKLDVVVKQADGRLKGHVTFQPSTWGIAPFKALLEALRLKDEVEVAFDLADPR